MHVNEVEHRQAGHGAVERGGEPAVEVPVGHDGELLGVAGQAIELVLQARTRNQGCCVRKDTAVVAGGVGCSREALQGGLGIADVKAVNVVEALGLR